MARDDMAFLYLPSNNPDERYIDGVPLRDLTLRDFAKLAPHLAAAVEQSPWYQPVMDVATALADDAQDAPQDTEHDESDESEPTVESGTLSAEDAPSDAQEDDKVSTPPAVEDAAAKQKTKRPRETK